MNDLTLLTFLPIIGVLAVVTVILYCFRIVGDKDKAIWHEPIAAHAISTVNKPKKASAETRLRLQNLMNDRELRFKRDIMGENVDGSAASTRSRGEKTYFEPISVHIQTSVRMLGEYSGRRPIVKPSL